MNTIAAIATAMKNSGISIVRISGDEAFSILDEIYRTGGKKRGEISEALSHTIHYGFIADGSEILDEVLVMIMRGPKSYTGEDTVEINCHGGILITKKILEAVLKYGARLAEPGEFTKRAFLNGRLDLAQAEAVMDVIHSKNEYARKATFRQLEGAVSIEVKRLREQLLYQIAMIESALDDPEHISLDGYSDTLFRIVEEVMEKLRKLIVSCDNGRVMTEGIRTVILGKPNTGKSSLLNVLVGEERAIVTEVAGTTRDTLEETIRLADITLNVVDTAGIRDTDDVVEKIGVEKARNAADTADLIIFVMDGSRPLDENDEEILRLLEHRRSVILLNKSDLDAAVTIETVEAKLGREVIAVSAKERTGMERLEEAVKSMFYRGEIDFNDQVIITNVRHKKALEEAYGSLELVVRSIENGMPEDFFSIDLMAAYAQLGLIIGEEVEDDLVNEIFGRFCMGK